MDADPRDGVGGDGGWWGGGGEGEERGEVWVLRMVGEGGEGGGCRGGGVVVEG